MPRRLGGTRHKVTCMLCNTTFPSGGGHACPVPDPKCWQAYSDSVKKKIEEIRTAPVRARSHQVQSREATVEVLQEMHAWLCDLTWQATKRKVT